MNSKKSKMVVLVSGSGTNLQAIIDQIESANIKAEIELVISSKENAYALTRAKKHNIACCVCSPKKYNNQEEYSQALLDLISQYQADLIVLAGFMSILSPSFIKQYQNRIMNTHPSLLPAFGGKNFYGNKVHQAVLDYGVKVSGATIMFVTQEIDCGPIILQEAVRIDRNETVDSLRSKVLKLEHELYPRAIKLFFDNKLEIKGRIVTQSNNKGEAND